MPPPTSVVEPDQITDGLEEPIPIKITHGYSGDRRPDLKQFMINLFTSEDGGIPLFLELGDGNEVDKSAFVPVIKEFQLDGIQFRAKAIEKNITTKSEFWLSEILFSNLSYLLNVGFIVRACHPYFKLPTFRR